MSTNPSVNLSSTSDAPTIQTSNTSHGDEFFDAQEDIPLVPSKPTPSDSAPAVSLTSDASDELFFTGVWMSTIENQSDPQIVTVQSTSSFVLEDSVILPPLEEEKASASIDDDPREENILVFDKNLDSESQDSKLESPTLYVDYLDEFYDSFEFNNEFYETDASDTSEYEEFFDCNEATKIFKHNFLQLNHNNILYDDG